MPLDVLKSIGSMGANMRLLTKSLKLAAIIIVFMAFLYVLGIPSAQASTPVSGSITVDTTWTVAESPYIVGVFNISSGVTLTIDPGVVVKFESQGSNITVNGALNASGTTADKIYFTSIKDDSVGGDTNGDGNVTGPAPEDWRQILLSGPGAAATFSNTVLRYGGSNYFPGSGGIVNNGGSLLVTSSEIAKNSIGILHWGGTTNINSSEIYSQGIGFFIKNGAVSIDSSSIHDHPQFGLYMDSQTSSLDLNLTNNIFSNNAVAATAFPVANFSHSGNTSSGSGMNGFEIGGIVNSDKTWVKDTMPYVVSSLSINSGATLNIDPGVVVKFTDGRWINIENGGTLNAGGTAVDKIYFTSIKDDAVGGDTNGDDVATSPAPGDWRNLKFNGGIGNLSNIVLRYAGYSTFLGNVGIYNNGGNLTITDSLITDNASTGLFQSAGDLVITSSEFNNSDYGIVRNGGIMNISGSSIHSNSQYGINNNGSSGVVTAQNNYWGNATGPFHPSLNPTGLGDWVSNNIDFIPFLTNDPFGPTPPPTVCIVDCFSNVLFLPGLMTSKLYDSVDNKLWLTTSDSDQAKLALNNQGQSIDGAIHTKDDTVKLSANENETGIIEEIFGLNTYKSFLEDLRKWKDDDQIIENYAFIPYDWRLSLDDITTNGSVSGGNIFYNASQNFSNSFILEKLTELQATSRTGKVTIIAHSNGGLVAKALIQKLKDTNDPLYEKIDKVILVAVPQVGTPNSLAALLHGSDLGPGGLIMSNERSRQLSENMPAIYNLLPSAGYFTTVDPAFPVDKLVSFENTPFFNPQTSQYGVFVSNATELKNYILGTDGRAKPSVSDTVHPNTGNLNLYAQAENVHQILDSWQPSPTTKIIQVAGWGEETLAGLDYISLRDTTEHLSYTLRHVVDGDGTVVTPSALWMSTSNPNVERWWVYLPAYDTLSNIERVHKDILEVSNLRDFIKSKIKDLTFNDQDHVILNSSSTLTSSDSRLHYTLHSPLTLGIIDAQGRYTGQDPATKQIKEEIPDVIYKQIGEVQFISAPAGTAYTLKLKGYQQGNFALDVEKQQGNIVTDSTSFQSIPSSISTTATIDIPTTFQVSTSTLKIDQNGDGVIDKTLQATPDGVTTYDVTPPELQVTFNINNKDVVFSAVDIIDQHPIVSINNNSITLTDSSGNTTIIPYIKFREIPTRLRLTYNKIIRNGIVTIVPNTHIIYDWQEKKGVLTDLDTKVVIKGVEKNVFNYKKVNNVTIVKEKTNSGVIVTTKPGFVAVTVKTEGDGLKVYY